MPELTVDAIRERIAVSRRYRAVSEAVIQRIAAEEIPKSRSLADAEKRTKRRLHQIFGAYDGRPDYASLLIDIQHSADRGDLADLRAACRNAMRCHASTRERLPELDSFYARILAETGEPGSIVDIACGLNPLAAPWMHLSPGARYVAYDIDLGMLDFVAGVLDLFGLTCRVEARDVVADPPVDACDVALVLKAIPCLDQQHPDAAARLLQTLQARSIVLSFPRQSLSGRAKGMTRTYEGRFASLLRELGWEARVRAELTFDSELVYVLGRME